MVQSRVVISDAIRLHLDFVTFNEVKLSLCYHFLYLQPFILEDHNINSTDVRVGLIFIPQNRAFAHFHGRNVDILKNLATPSLRGTSGRHQAPL